MTIFDIKVSALKLIFAKLLNEGVEIRKEQDILGSEYADQYLIMNDSINRAIDYITNKGVVPTKSFKVSAQDTTGKYIKVSLGDNRQNIVKVLYSNDNGIETNIVFDYLDDKTIMLPKRADGEYIIEYKPVLTIIDSYTPSDSELDLPEQITRLIPYFIKSEVYEEDEPSASENARKYFENGINALIKVRPNPTKIKAVLQW